LHPNHHKINTKNAIYKVNLLKASIY